MLWVRWVFSSCPSEFWFFNEIDFSPFDVTGSYTSSHELSFKLWKDNNWKCSSKFLIFALVVEGRVFLSRWRLNPVIAFPLTDMINVMVCNYNCKTFSFFVSLCHCYNNNMLLLWQSYWGGALQVPEINDVTPSWFTVDDWKYVNEQPQPLQRCTYEYSHLFISPSGHYSQCTVPIRVWE